MIFDDYQYQSLLFRGAQITCNSGHNDDGDNCVQVQEKMKKKVEAKNSEKERG